MIVKWKISDVKYSSCTVLLCKRKQEDESCNDTGA